MKLGYDAKVVCVIFICFRLLLYFGSLCIKVKSAGLSLKKKQKMQFQLGEVGELRKRPMRDGQNKCI